MATPQTPIETALEDFCNTAVGLAAAEYELDKARDRFGKAAFDARQAGVSIPRLAGLAGLSIAAIHKYSMRHLPEGAEAPRARTGRPKGPPKPPKKPRPVDDSPEAQARRETRKRIQDRARAKRAREREAARGHVASRA